MSTTPSARGQLSKGPQRLLRVIIHTLVLLLAFSLSGVARALEAGGEDPRECCTDCPDQDDGRDCPPGCPSCHCAHGSVAVPRAVDDRVVVRLDLERDATPCPDEATAPRAPMLRGVYR